MESILRLYLPNLEILQHEETPLHVAISQGLEDIAAELIPKMPMKMLNACCGSGLRPLYLAIQKNQFKMTQLLLKSGAKVNMPSYVGNLHRVTAFQLALHLENYKLMDLLLQYEPEVIESEATSLLKLSLQRVVKEDCRNIFKFICERRIPGKHFCKKIIFELLPLAKSPEMGDLLFEKFFCNHIKVTVDIALGHNMIGIIEYFIKNNADFINKVDNFGYTYLHYAVVENRPQITEVMIKSGFNIEAKSTNSGKTSLHIAAKYGNEAIAQILIENGANVDSQAFKNLTPLMIAIQFNMRSIAKFLIENGASLNKRNIKGLSPLEIALKQKKFDIAKVICESK